MRGGSEVFVNTRCMLMKVYMAVSFEFILGILYSIAGWAVKLLYCCLWYSVHITFLCLLCICPPLGVSYLAVKYICQRRGKQSSVCDKLKVE